MKISTFVFSASLLANVALAAVFLSNGSKPVDGANTVPGRDVASPTLDVTKAAMAAGADTSAPVGHALWKRMYPTDDLASLVTRLRAAGFPPNVIRRVIGALVNERFDARRLEIEKKNLEAPFWANTPNSFADKTIGPELRKLQVEQTKMVKQLLGGTLSDLFGESEDGKAMLRMQIGDIAPEKLDKLYDFFMDYSEKRMQVYSATGNGSGMMPADREKLVQLDKGMHDGLTQFLTPAEADDVVMRMSETAGRLRSMLAPFKATEEEYRTLFPIYQAYLQQAPAATFSVGSADMLPPDLAAQRKLADDAMLTQVKAALGDQRAADYQQVMNQQYSTLNRLVSRLDLPLSAAKQVVDIQQDVQQRASAVRLDGAVTGAERTAQLGALAQEASEKITNVLGAQGLDAYKQYGGQWLTSLVPRTPPPKK
jgi:hypothetical protein